MSARRDIAPADRAWFDRTCRAQARVGCRGRPDLWDDAEAEARARAWLAYRAGRSRSWVALEARTGAWLLWQSECTRFERDPETGTGRHVAGGRANLYAERLTLLGAGGEEYDNPALCRAGRVAPPVSEAVLSRAAAAALLALLPEAEAALVARVAGGERQSDLAAEAGVSQQAVSAAYRRALRRLRECPEAAAWLTP